MYLYIDFAEFEGGKQENGILQQKLWQFFKPLKSQCCFHHGRLVYCLMGPKKTKVDFQMLRNKVTFLIDTDTSYRKSTVENE